MPSFHPLLEDPTMTKARIALQALVLVLALCAGTQSGLAQTAKFTAKIPKAAGNADSLENATMARFAMLVRERTKGAVEIQPLYGP
jgi:TRAP-type C4-dicarboxylate transport system substrate-binding protein